MTPFQNSRCEWPTVLALLAAFVVAVLTLTSCSLHTSVVGHRTDQPTVVIATADEDGGR